MLKPSGELAAPAEERDLIQQIIHETDDLHIARTNDAGEMLDTQAKAAYQSRIEELRDELKDAKERGSVDRAEEIQEEINAIAGELKR